MHLEIVFHIQSSPTPILEGKFSKINPYNFVVERALPVLKEGVFLFVKEKNALQ